MIGSNIQSYMDAEGRKRIREANINIYQSGIPGRYTHEIIRKDGTRRILEDSVSLIRNADNIITGFRGFERDVTDKCCDVLRQTLEQKTTIREYRIECGHQKHNRQLANLETTVLVTGESGTGKELVAKALHYSGQRALRPFVTVNCSALAESLLKNQYNCFDEQAVETLHFECLLAMLLRFQLFKFSTRPDTGSRNTGDNGKPHKKK